MLCRTTPEEILAVVTFGPFCSSATKPPYLRECFFQEHPAQSQEAGRGAVAEQLNLECAGLGWKESLAFVPRGEPPS